MELMSDSILLPANRLPVKDHLGLARNRQLTHNPVISGGWGEGEGEGEGRSASGSILHIWASLGSLASLGMTLQEQFPPQKRAQVSTLIRRNSLPQQEQGQGQRQEQKQHSHFCQQRAEMGHQKHSETTGGNGMRKTLANYGRTRGR